MESTTKMPSSKMLFTDYIELWLERKRDSVERSTWEGYTIYAQRHVIPFFAELHLRLEDVKPFHIRAYYESKFRNGRLDGKPGGLSIPSIKKHSIILKESLREAVVDGLLERNPAEGVRLPGKDVAKRERTFLTKDQVNKLLALFDGKGVIRDLVYITLLYGLRRSEVVGLRWRSIDFAAKTLTIEHTVVKFLTIEEKDSTKTQASYHVFPLLDSAAEVFKKILREDSSGDHNGYVFRQEDGSPMRPDTVTRTFEKIARRGGFDHMRFHDLRHSTASLLYDNSWDMRDIQHWLRHSSIEVTADIYTHISASRESEIAKSVEASIFSPTH